MRFSNSKLRLTLFSVALVASFQCFAQNANLELQAPVDSSELESANVDETRINNPESIVVQPAMTEILRAKPPAGWKLAYQFNNDDTRFADFTPADEDNKTWRTKLSIESHQNMDDIDPISAIMGEVQNNSEICSNFNHFNLFSGIENGYPTSVRLIECGENAHSNKGEISIIKAIQGNEHFYFVRLLRRTEPFSDSAQAMETSEIAAWSTYLKDITVCDTQHADHSCLPEKKN